MEVLSEGDPGLCICVFLPVCGILLHSVNQMQGLLTVGLQKKRALLPGQGVPTLSQLLQEAKSQPEATSETSPSDTQVPVSYSRLFDEYNGVVHLEALELLSRECDSKVHTHTQCLAGIIQSVYIHVIGDLDHD